MRPVTPRGFRDVLFDEAAERSSVARAIGEAFRRYGYRFVETPAVEEYRTLETAAGASLEGTAFRMVDLDGSLLALRPEMTLPIARLAASRLTPDGAPHRLCYKAEVFREHASLRGEARQFTQVGIELLGVNGPASDAEVVTALVDALRATGMRSFTVGVGTVAPLRALLAGSGLPEAVQREVMRAAHERNLVAIDTLTRAPGVDQAAGRALRAIVRIRGGRDAIERAAAIAGDAGCGDALGALARTWDAIEAAGAADCVIVDLGILRSFDYYTGLVVEAYAPGLGLPLGGGGRYDDVLAAFDAPMPAAGFALSLERVMIALAEQDVRIEVPRCDVAIGGADDAEVARAAAALRADGLSVTVVPAADAAAILERAESLAAARAMIVRDGVVLDLPAVGGGRP